MISTILVVDDDTSFRELVVDILCSEGYRLLEAAQLSLRDRFRADGADGGLNLYVIAAG